MPFSDEGLFGGKKGRVEPKRIQEASRVSSEAKWEKKAGKDKEGRERGEKKNFLEGEQLKRSPPQASRVRKAKEEYGCESNLGLIDKGSRPTGGKKAGKGKSEKGKGGGCNNNQAKSICLTPWEVREKN